MNGDWLQREALIAVKAYPNPSAKYDETVCVAAITREEGWIRLYPVQFRSLPRDKSFEKYQIVRLRMRRHERDPRPESYRPDEHSLELLEVLGTGRDRMWDARRAWIEPTVSPSMCEILRQQKRSGKSLGVFKPARILDFVAHDAAEDWPLKKQAILDQLTLYDAERKPLEKIPFVFKYTYQCGDSQCGGHEQSIIDWEIMELYRKLRGQGAALDVIKRKIRQKYLDEICGPKKDTHLFVGNHSRFPQSFMVLGTFWPPKRSPRLFD